jgi:hypothetical protein
MKKNLWTFGDSYTYGYSCLPYSPHPEYFFNYTTKKDDIWPNILAKKLNLNIKNKGTLNATNDSILDNLIDCYNLIKKGDVVILGKTLYQRFDIYNFKKNILWHIGPHTLKDGKIPDNIFIASDDELNGVCKNNDEYEILLKYIYHFPISKLHEERQNKRFDFIKERLLDKNIDFYEWRTEDYFFDNKKFEDITEHTKGKIENIHLSYNGHRQFAEHFYKKITNKKII